MQPRDVDPLTCAQSPQKLCVQSSGLGGRDAGAGRVGGCPQAQPKTAVHVPRHGRPRLCLGGSNDDEMRRRDGWWTQFCQLQAMIRLTPGPCLRSRSLLTKPSAAPLQC